MHAVKDSPVTRLSRYLPLLVGEESRRWRWKGWGGHACWPRCSRNARPKKGLVRRPHL